MFNTSTNYQVVTNCNFTLEDYKLIVKYYQPIVGTYASSLYLTLVNELNDIFNSKVYNIKKLQKLTNMSLDQVYKSILILGKVGLANIYQSNDRDEYIFDMIKPKDQHDFFMDNVLCKALQENLGSELFSLFVDENRRIPYSFNNYTLINSNLNIKSQDTKASKDYYLRLFSGLGLANMPREIEELANFSYANKLTVEEINDTVQKTSINDIVNVYSFKSVIKLSKLSKGDVLNSKQVDEGEIFSSEDYFNIVDHTPSEVFLKRLNNGRKLSSGESSIINILRMDYRLLDPVINVLIDYVFKVNTMILNRSLVESIAASWQRNNISTSRQAVNFVKDYNKKKKQASMSKSNNVQMASNTPEWLVEQVNNKNENKIISDEIQFSDTEIVENSKDFDLFAKFNEE